MTMTREEFQAALDESGGGGGDYEPIPPATYEFVINEVKEAYRANSGAWMTDMEYEIINDPDGYAGRKVWDRLIWDGVTSKAGYKAFNLLNLVNGIIERFPDTFDELADIPYFTPGDPEAMVVPEGGEYLINQYARNLVGKLFFAKTKNEKWTGRDGDEKISTRIKVYLGRNETAKLVKKLLPF